MLKHDFNLYRLEGPEGYGPFCGDGSFYLYKHSEGRTISDRHSSYDKDGNRRYPNPSNDFEICEVFESGIHYFGYNSEDKIRLAFTHEEFQEFFNDYKFKLFRYTVKEGYSSQFQTIFKKEDVIEKEDITHLFK